MSGFNIFAIMNDVNFCLLGSIGQAGADAKTLNLWSNSTMNKTGLWLNGGLGDNDDPTIKNAIDALDGKGIDAFVAFLKNNCPAADPNSPFSINNWSSGLALRLQMMITKNDDDPSKWTAVVGAVGPFSSLISSMMTQDTTTGDSEGKNAQSQLSTDNSALQPIADFGGSWAQTLSSLSNVLGQISVA